jgi:hypothetical protein
MNRPKLRASSMVVVGGMINSWRALTTSTSAGPSCLSAALIAASSCCGFSVDDVSSASLRSGV